MSLFLQQKLEMVGKREWENGVGEFQGKELL